MIQMINLMLNKFIHQWLHFPYRLHIEELLSPSNPNEIVILIHGMGNSLNSWNPVIKGLSNNTRVIAIDMLGFGKSPKPLWESYNVTIQAVAIARTLIGLKLRKKPIIVGHSMGALVAIELAKKFPLLIKKLILCSPPLYENQDEKTWKGQERLLKQFYRLLSQYPEKLEPIAQIAIRMGIVSNSFNLEGDTSKVYAAALQSSIIKQTSVNDLLKLKLPISILYGQLDPLIITSTIKKVTSQRANIAYQSVLAGHEMQGVYADFIAKHINSITN